jgi:hypothetical protein
MKHTAIFLSLFAVGAIATFSACSTETEAAGPETTASKSGAAEAAPADDQHPLHSSLTKRASDRWQLIENEDWIQSYSYLSKEIRAFQDLGSYLKGSSEHRYVVKSDPVLVGQDGQQAFVQVLVEWTPTHAELKTAANAAADGFTQDIDMIETWVWEQGDWYFVNGDRARDFIQAHPKMFRRDEPAAPESPETAVLEQDDLK